MKMQRTAWQINGYRIASLLLHISAVVAIVALLRHVATDKPAISPARRETARLVFTLPGSVESGSPKAAAKNVAKVAPGAVAYSKPKPQRRGELSQTPSTGEGTLGHSAWGEGQITIAYTKFFPPPKPDLSMMRPGTEGDVVLAALIDEQGKISDLTLVAGIVPAIDQDVMQTVRQWTFTPATKDGLPVASKQELHFHFRSGRDG